MHPKRTSTEAASNMYGSIALRMRSGWNLTKHWMQALGYFVIKRHLVIDLRKMDMAHTGVEAQINGYTLHPSLRIGIATPFDGNDRDGKNMLVQGKDFLSAHNGGQRV
jgi:hypothetical protein